MTPRNWVVLDYLFFSYAKESFDPLYIIFESGDYF